MGGMVVEMAIVNRWFGLVWGELFEGAVWSAGG